MNRGEITFNREVAPGHFMLTVTVPERFETPQPGQFVMVHLRDRLDVLLGRPLSVYAFERQRNGATMEFLYRVVGKGTACLSRLREGDSLDLLGPLGTGFHTPSSVGQVVIVAGGMGVAPLTYLAYHYRRRVSSFLKITCYLGAKSAMDVIGLERLQDLCSEVILTTDDGSLGACGMVTDALAPAMTGLDRGEVFVYACGPQAMMKCLAEQMAGRSVPCQVSLEERMACGVGACLGCAVALKNRMGGRYYGRVCKDGPVFNIRRVEWES